MAEKLEVYKCEVCGNIVLVMHGGKGELVCCGQPMKLFKENTVDAAKEKHYIEWIELLAGEKSYVQFLKAGDAPEALFKVDADQVTARAYCNLHGLWKG